MKSLVELHGGRVTAASDGQDRGAKFSVKLPLSAAEPAPAAAVAGPLSTRLGAA